MIRRLSAAVVASGVLAACGHSSHSPALAPIPIPEATGPNTLTAAERHQGWQLLFDGRTLTGWHTYQQPLGVTKGWAVEDGAIARVDSLGDLVSDAQFSNFELDLEWKVSPGANSGIFWWANEGTQYVYMNAAEMQVLDNADFRPDGGIPKEQAGALYDLIPVPADTPVKPAGQWNQVRIIAHGSKVQLWLNGVRTANVNFDSDRMLKTIKNSKFNAWQSFGKSRRGHIALQDHTGKVWFRNIKIKSNDRSY